MILIFLNVIFTLSLPASAITGNLSWKNCVEEVQNNNAELASAIEKHKSARYLLKSSYGLFLPSMDVYLNNKIKESGESSSKYSAGITITENLFSGFDSVAQTRRSKANLKLTEADLRTVKAKVSYDLKSAYASLLYTQNSITLLDDIIKRRKENLNLVELRYENGRENKGSVLLSKAYLNQANYEKLQAVNNMSVYGENLLKTLSNSKYSDVTVNDHIPVPSPESNPDYKNIALDTPAYIKAIANEEVAESELTMSRSAFYPSLSLTGSYSKTGETFFPGNENWYMGLSLSFPIFNAGRDYYSTKSAASELKAKSFNRVDTLLGIIAELKQAYSSYIEIIEKLKVDKSFFKAATVRADIARSKYNNGLITFDDWDLIENDLITRQKAVLASQKDKVIRGALWEQKQGKGVIK